ncbi:hypothetical protein I6I68_00700 [Corynebacterium glucuronolyticum]|uniref:hypothetical protein n=1 Tax=Corynebacterium glucuronolyticum TaxID=39791 RepID=UPI00191F9A97|nr:hypothetical protein [Corynebacterium glucuronolyticum]QQU88559.1 hypothetical protein I6I68_00700 [Corynebacterium glucuronolyticum]
MTDKKSGTQIDRENLEELRDALRSKHTYLARGIFSDLERNDLTKPQSTWGINVLDRYRKDTLLEDSMVTKLKESLAAGNVKLSQERLQKLNEVTVDNPFLSEAAAQLESMAPEMETFDNFGDWFDRMSDNFQSSFGGSSSGNEREKQKGREDSSDGQERTGKAGEAYGEGFGGVDSNDPLPPDWDRRRKIILLVAGLAFPVLSLFSGDYAGQMLGVTVIGGILGVVLVWMNYEHYKSGGKAHGCIVETAWQMVFFGLWFYAIAFNFPMGVAVLYVAIKRRVWARQLRKEMKKQQEEHEYQRACEHLARICSQAVEIADSHRRTRAGLWEMVIKNTQGASVTTGTFQRIIPEGNEEMENMRIADPFLQEGDWVLLNAQSMELDKISEDERRLALSRG